MKFIKYYNASDCRLALSNLCNRIGGSCSITDIEDAIEDARTSAELRDNLNSLKLLEHFTIDRETSSYVRLISVDSLGNKHYIKAEFD